MKISRTLIAIVVILIVAVAGLVAYTALSAPPPSCTSTWKCASAYPLQVGGTAGVAGQQCLANSTEVFCVGGVDVNGGPRNEVYTTTLTTSGNITGWSQDPNGYPQDVSGQACVASSSYVYCVGGIHDDAEDNLAASYFSRMYPNGSLGHWQSTTPYPIPIDSEACVAWTSHIYCIGGNNETGGSESNVMPSSSVWFASLNSSGIGNWARSTPYPSGIYVPSCFAADGFVYCLGGSNSNGDPLGTGFFASLTSNGVGQWTVTTTYPVASAGDACVVASEDVYCIGGITAGGQPPSFTDSVYYATISSGGIGGWKQGAGYPRPVGTSCFATEGSVYCVGGFDESTPGEGSIVNYASAASISG